MLRNAFRPWGLLPWVLGRLDDHHWSVIANLSTEDRCLAAWRTLKERDRVGDVRFIEIRDSAQQYRNETEEKLRLRRQEHIDAGGNADDIEAHRLLESDDSIVTTARTFAISAGENVMVDISTFPKKFFFPIVKVLLGAAGSGIKNLIATYTRADRYPHSKLAEDICKPPYLHPMFAPPFPEPKEKVQIVGIGFEPLGLPEFLKGQEFELLMPIPWASRGMQRTWDFVRKLEPYVREPKRVYADNVAEIFDHILSLTNRGQRYAVFSPYGPKTMSLAMCLYAVSEFSASNRPAVYYSQPTVYNPDYSLGVKRTPVGDPVTYAYCLRLDGVDLY